MSASNVKRPRYLWLDSLRGLAVVLMVVHHLLYDLCLFGFLGWAWFTNPLFDVLHNIFVCVFLGVSGICCRFSRSNLLRGIKCLGCAAAVTLVTWLMDMPIWFGILHLLGLSMTLYGLLQRWLSKVPGWILLAVYTMLLIVATQWLIPSSGLTGVVPWILGVEGAANIGSADYFPIFPWMLVFFIGTVLGREVEKLPFSEKKGSAFTRFFAFTGRHALWVYLAHQPLLYGIVWLLDYLVR